MSVIVEAVGGAAWLDVDFYRNNITNISYTIAITIKLIMIRHIRTIIAHITHTIGVGIELVWIRLRRTIINVILNPVTV